MNTNKLEITYYCDSFKIEKNAAEQLEKYSTMPHLEKLVAYTDIHYCSEKGIPVGVAFKTKDVFYPLVIGKDAGCGVAYAKIPKINWLKPFDKKEHYRALEKAHRDMTDDGLGGGNHFLSIEEDNTHIYVICHTGSRNLGIALYQESFELTQLYSDEIGEKVDYVSVKWIEKNRPEYINYHLRAYNFAKERRNQFITKTIDFLKRNKYTNFDGSIFISDSAHNHLQFTEGGIIHRKGSTEINPGDEVAIPLSMTRGTLIVKAHEYTDMTESLNSCSHGAGRKLSRFDSMKYWKTVLKEKERKQYKEKFPELLDRSGNFSSGYIQEFDYAYKDSSDILENQPYLRLITQTTPIITIKYTEI